MGKLTSAEVRVRSKSGGRKTEGHGGHAGRREGRKHYKINRPRKIHERSNFKLQALDHPKQTPGIYTKQKTNTATNWMQLNLVVID